MFKYFTLDDFDFKGKIVGLRVDINSPQVNGKIVMNERIANHSLTIKELVEKGARVVLLAHQGRNGKPDCVSLKEHSVLIEKEIGLKKKVNFVNDIYSKDVVSKIKSLKDGEVIILENLRFYDDETKLDKKDNKILKLESLFDYYVFDAFSVSHRKQTSVIGFNKIPNVAGKIMEKELMGLNRIMETKAEHIFVFGGAKPDDLVELMEIDLKSKKVDKVLLTGIIGEIALHIKGYHIGKKYDFLKEHGYLDSYDRIKTLLSKYKDKIYFPKDVALFDGKKRIEIKIKDFKENKNLLDKYLIQDIGKETFAEYKLIMQKAGSIYFKGPAGNFEMKGFETGTKEILDAITSSPAFTFMGGGHSVTAAKMYGYLNKFSYVSLAGGALVKFLCGSELPGVSSLEKSTEKYERVYEDFVVIGSNTIDTGVNVPKSFVEVNIGDKIKIEDDFKTTVGGGGINVSMCLSRLGAKVGYLGKISYESYDMIKDVLDKSKIVMIKSKPTKKPCAKSILMDTKDHDRIIMTFRGQNSYLEESDFSMESFRSNNYYLTSLMGQSLKTQIGIVKKVKARNKKSFFCYNASSYIIRTESAAIKQLIKSIDVLVLNYDEAQLLSGKESVTDCLIEIKKMVSTLVVVTDGSNGSYAYDGEKEYFCESVKPKKVIDTTGAGDSFAGTFFYFYTKGYGIKRSMKLAAHNSSSVITKKGAQDGLMFYDDIIKLQ